MKQAHEVIARGNDRAEPQSVFFGDRKGVGVPTEDSISSCPVPTHDNVELQQWTPFEVDNQRMSPVHCLRNHLLTHSH